MSRKNHLRHCLIVVFWISIAGIIGLSYYCLEYQIPNQLHVVVEEEETFHFPFPVSASMMDDCEEVVLNNGSNIPSDQIKLDRNQNFSVYSKSQGTYHMSLKLFGILPLKEVQVDVVDTQYAIPCGSPIGIYLEAEGVMVIGTGEVITDDGTPASPAEGILQSGDYIESMNGTQLKDKEQLMSCVRKNGNKPAVLGIRRKEEAMQLTLTPVHTQEGDYKLGVWVRSDTQGIGTVTYVDMNGNFGALGHGISDSDTGDVIDIRKGSLYETAIVGIQKGTAGNPGIMSGVIYYGPGSCMGTISNNTEEGIFGSVNDHFKKEMSSETFPIGYRQDIVKGPAVIRSNISGKSKDYQIEIQRIDTSSLHKNKGLVIKVTDPDLLKLTGGIIQGMSGSPIIQNGKLIGAVTHVFIQDSSRGYGIFLENMLEASK